MLRQASKAKLIGKQARVPSLGLAMVFALTLLIQSWSLAGNRCEEYLVGVKDPKAFVFGGQFLHERNSKMHTTAAVEKATKKEFLKTGDKVQKPSEKLAIWLRHLEDFTAKLNDKPRAVQNVKELFYQKYVLKIEEIPEGYYELQKRIARERGHGDIHITTELKAELGKRLIQDQKKSLDKWIDYLLSPQAKAYPMWVKYWVLTDLVKLSKFDVTKGNFAGRDKGTVAPFPELNAEAMALVVDLVIKKMDRKSLQEIQDPQLIQLVERANFGRLYGHVLSSLGPANSTYPSNEGVWKKYVKGSDHLKLVADLEGHNSGWCIAADATAQEYLGQGDIHIFYSQDLKGRAILPRVAIRFEGTSITEVRGVKDEQHLDPEIAQTSVVDNKLHEFGAEGLIYTRRSVQTKLLTQLENKTQLGMALTKEELVFLYEINERIVGFGTKKDPRIAEIISKRNPGRDLTMIFQGMQEYRGDIELDFVNLEGLVLPPVIYGSVTLRKMTSAQGITWPREIYGSLDLAAVKFPQGLILPKVIEGKLVLSNLVSAQGVVFPEVIGGMFTLSALQHEPGNSVLLPRVVNGALYLSSLRSLEGIKMPEVVNGSISLTALPNFDGVQVPEGAISITTRANTRFYK